MKGKPLIPFFLIAVAGLVLTVGLSLVGVGQQASEGEQGGEMDPVARGEQVVNENCISCHGENLQGGSGPAIQNVGSDMSAEEIANIAQNGVGDMPSGVVSSAEDAQAVAEYLLSLSEE
ncbi:c-type cytochrome [Salibacterium halotolerans]|uniref:Cytochrome c550 n=1 Tax=Salibacterium halotolerans TaxID=1884432 RepID=A0A1I5NHD0_9BACI|nr:cytochrome c [Salibacterium halotolerans]SFP21228.1 cytochrome c550 [Salibacterium halotolerans]